MSMYGLTTQRALMVSPPPVLKRPDCGWVSGSATPGSTFKAKSPSFAGRGLSLDVSASDAWASWVKRRRAALASAVLAWRDSGDLRCMVVSV
jgi:hypothetical protein